MKERACMSFEKFYSVYPRRINLAQAQKACIKAIKQGATDEQLVNGAYEYAQWCERNGTAKEYICHPATWLLMSFTSLRSSNP